MKIRVTVDLDDKEELCEQGSLEHGVYGVDKDGVYHLYYGSRTDLVKFINPRVIIKVVK